MPVTTSCYCEKCGRTMSSQQFYTSNDLEKYPSGRFNMCKKCLTMHVDNWDPETYLWILKEADVPYVPSQWYQLLEKYGRNKSDLTGMTILGRYLSAMRLHQYREYRWKDTEFLQELEKTQLEAVMKNQGYSAAEIATAIEKKNSEIPQGEIEMPDFSDDPPPGMESSAPVSALEDDDELDLGLTEEDITYLRLKWGKKYKQEEWLYLEQLYEDMMSSYDIQTAGHIDTLKLVCKASLKANQLIDIGDIESFQRVSKVYDGLMKSGRFTAAQNKAESGEYIDSISELVAICESDGFIPRYYTDGPQDKVDRTLQDLQSYTRTLVTEEMNLGNLIEQAVRQIEEDRVKEAENNEDIDDEELLENNLFSEDSVEFLDENSYTEFQDFGDELAKEDEELLQSLMEEGE